MQRSYAAVIKQPWRIGLNVTREKALDLSRRGASEAAAAIFEEAPIAA